MPHMLRRRWRTPHGVIHPAQGFLQPVPEKQKSVSANRARRFGSYAPTRMRVIGRVLLGTLAMLFAVVFIARLVRRRVHARARHVGPPRLPSVVPARPRPSDAPRPLPRPPAHVYLAAQRGGSGWGHLVVPPSSPSRALRRNGRRLNGRPTFRVVRRAARRPQPQWRKGQRFLTPAWRRRIAARGFRAGARRRVRDSNPRALPG
jgi:hypothetical protein